MILSVREASRIQPPSRLVTRLAWFDAVTGGGLPAGAAAMLFGAPGAGKSTLLAQVAGSVPGSLYVSLEEPLSAVAARFQRLGLEARLSDDVADAVRADTVLILDSIQMTEQSVTTLHDVIWRARERGVAVVAVCHATKAGDHAGPRTLEHLVDMTLRLDRQPRALVCLKNRFGPAPQWLPLEMTERGLRYEDRADDSKRDRVGGDSRRGRRWHG